MLRDQNFGPGEGRDKQSRTILDFGPPLPVMPTQQRPTAPDANLVGAERVTAWEAYERDTAAYENGRHAYIDAKRAYDQWHSENQIYPVKKTLPVIDAREACDRDPERYQFWFAEPAAAVEAA